MDIHSGNSTNLSSSFWGLIFIGIVLLFSYQDSFSQTKDSLKPVPAQDTLAVKKTKHSPALATILSTVCPGAGQIYNRKYWKLPIVWGGMGAFGYLFFSQNSRYQGYKKALIARLDTDSTTVDNQFPQYTDSQISQLKENTKYNRDLMAVLAGLFYVLNIVDANVDGHLYDFDVSENLSMRLEPTTLPINTPTRLAPGISLTLNFKK
jgi:hypothetical protein